MTLDNDSQGHDSFLDIVANLVGILIILVVVVGASATAAWQKAPETSEHIDQLESLKSERIKTAEQAANLKEYDAETRHHINYQRLINDRLAANRHQALVAIESQKRQLAARSDEVSEATLQAQLLSSEIDELEQQIKQVQYAFNAVVHSAHPEAQEIEHFPTPIAKTVFSEEIHFHLSGHRLAYVPMDELVDAMKSDFKAKAKDASQAGQTWESVMPIGQFRLKYLLNVVQNPSNPSQYGAKFERFILQPTVEILGESVAEALRNGSLFDKRLSRRKASNTTVTFWVFPDSFEDLAKIRKHLRDRGFQTAAWPMSFGQFISGSPNGFRTSTN